jgi:regulatory protein
MRAYGKRKERGPVPPLDLAALERLGLRYVERFATTRGKLTDYFRRKLRERGAVDGFDPESIAPLVEKFARAGYVDDASWAGSKASSLTRRGYGPRRVGDALKAAGIEPDLAQAVAPDEAEAEAAAETYARKRKFGRFGATEPDRAVKRKQLAAMLRAGHGFDVARRLVEAGPGEGED